jgi:hypothetical protein
VFLVRWARHPRYRFSLFFIDLARNYPPKWHPNGPF